MTMNYKNSFVSRSDIKDYIYSVVIEKSGPKLAEVISENFLINPCKLFGDQSADDWIKAGMADDVMAQARRVYG